MSETNRYKAVDRVMLTKLDDGTGVLLHLDTKFYYTLNATGVFAWNELDSKGGASLDELADAVTQEFEVDDDTARRDLGTLLDELVAEELVKR